MGANANSTLFYNRVKGQTENEVQALGLRSLIIFRPALLVGPRRRIPLSPKKSPRERWSPFRASSRLAPEKALTLLPTPQL